MKQKTKILTIILFSAVTGALLFMPLTQAFEPSGQPESETIVTMIQEEELGPRAAIRIKLAWWFINTSEPVEIEGTSVNLSQDMLVVGTINDQIRVHLPSEWTVGSEIINRGELFTSGYLREGENITIKALEATLINKEGFRIYLLVGYKIINKSNAHAYANLRVNIED